MCWACQNVYELTQKWKVYWMNEMEDRKNIFRFEYVEWLVGDYSCVISEVKMKRIGPKLYEMTQDQRDKIENILGSALSGKPKSADDVDAVSDATEELSDAEEGEDGNKDTEDTADDCKCFCCCEALLKGDKSCQEYHCHFLLILCH